MSKYIIIYIYTYTYIIYIYICFPMIHEYTMIFRWLSPFDPKLSMGSLPTPEALAKSELIERDALVCIEYPREIGAAGTKVGGLGVMGSTPSHHGGTVF
jgi:hypothetical protein